MKNAASTASQTVYIVSGFMRTGTSMMMRALEAGGMQACYRQSREDMRKRYADEHYDPNFGGLYELERKDYQKWDFPRGYEGKLIKALSLGVPQMDVMPDGIRVVFMRRHPEEIRQSYLAFFNRDLRGTERLDERMEHIIARIENRRDVLSMDVLWYREVVERPLECFERLRDRGWPIDVKAAVATVNPELCRYKLERLTIGVL